ncbi:hypothetical protein OHV80_11440 [Acinetobacter baumannii]|nr:hypothetical protein [Acinetobacter baumannii]
MALMSEVLEERRNEYCCLVTLLEDFAHRFVLTIEELAKFLLINKFSNTATAYVNINKTDYAQLSRENSIKSIDNILNIMNDKKFNNSRLLSGDDGDLFEYAHIHILEAELYNFPPLKELDFEYGIGYQILGKVDLNKIDYKELIKAEREYYESQPEIFSDEWYALHPKLQELRNMPVEEPNINNSFDHPSLDKENQNHAPELLLAIQVWEAKYINNEYPYQEHTPAIKTILKNRGYTNTRLIDRIAAITNPNKKINKQ